MTRFSLFAAVASFVMGLIVSGLSVSGGWMGSDLFSLLLIPCFLVSLYLLHALLNSYFHIRKWEEDEERRLLEKRKKKTAFDDSEGMILVADRALRRYRRFAPFAVVAASLALTAGSLAYFSREWMTRVELAEPYNMLQAAFASILISLLFAMGGIFCIGQSREKGFRHLRPPGALLVFAFMQSLVCGLTLLFTGENYPFWDGLFAGVFFWAYVVLGVEVLFNTVIEFYRPRTVAEERPVYESRILGLFTEPGGVAKNIALTLDYQFGFKASRTWIYEFLGDSIVPLTLFWLITLWLGTSLSQVDSGEVGFRETFGMVDPAKPLGPGLCLKLPWPFGRINKVPTDRIREVVVGVQESELKEIEAGKRDLSVITWTNKHYENESRFIVPADPDRDDKIPLSIIAAVFPIQYRVKPEQAGYFAYGHRNPEELLKLISEREILIYLASVDMIKLMSTGRSKAISDLTMRIQEECNRKKLGVEIVQANLHDAHPPSNTVAEAFEDVVGARELKETMILAAEVYRNETIPDAEATAYRHLSEAQAYRTNRIKVAEAEEEHFRKQLLAYRKMPAMYKLNSFLSFLEVDCANLRKYIVPSSSRHNVYIINLEEKPGIDLTEFNLENLE